MNLADFAGQNVVLPLPLRLGQLGGGRRGLDRRHHVPGPRGVHHVPAQSVAPFALAVDAARQRRAASPTRRRVVAPTWRNTGRGAHRARPARSPTSPGRRGRRYTIADAHGDLRHASPSAANASCTAGRQLLRGATPAATRPAAALGQHGRWRRSPPRRRQDVDAARRRQLHRRAGHATRSTASSRRCCTGASPAAARRPILPGNRHHPRADGGLRARVQGGRRLHPARLRAAQPVHRRPGDQPFCRWIEELANRGVVTGCGGGNYCPSSPVTREQMAVFVLRTLDPALNPPACVPPTCSRTSRRPARSAAGSRSWPAAAS